MKCDELKPLVFSINDLAYVDEQSVQKNFENPHDHAVYKATEVDAAFAEFKAENERLKGMMPKYEQFIKDEDFRKKLVDEYAGYVYDWKGHAYIATPYINLFIKGILRALWLERAERAKAIKWHEGLERYLQSRKKWWPSRFSFMSDDEMYHEWYRCWCEVERKCQAKAEEYK